MYQVTCVKGWGEETRCNSIENNLNACIPLKVMPTRLGGVLGWVDNENELVGVENT